MAEQQLRLLDGEGKEAFLQTVVREIRNHELDCVTQQRCSRIVEYLLRHINELETFRPLFGSLLGVKDATTKAKEAGEETTEQEVLENKTRVFRLLAENQYSSHVLQTLFGVAAEKNFLYNGSDGTLILLRDLGTALVAVPKTTAEEQNPSASGSNATAVLESAWIQICQDRSGSHVGRALLLAVGGFLVEKKMKANNKAKKGKM
ncbi:unnamed protein product, partial [Amoebophrya sp. A25]|eukprot:GSA25T00001059001.1